MEFYFPFSPLVGGLLVAAIALYASVFGWKRIVRKRRALASQNWPWVDAKIEKSSTQLNEYSDGGVSWGLKLCFTYRAPSSSHWYQGVYAEEFGLKADAEAQLQSLRERQLYARYNPSDPSDYFIDPYRDIFNGEQESSQRVLKY